MSVMVALALGVVLTLSGLGTTLTSAAEANRLAGWSYRVPLTIDHAKIAASLTDLPILSGKHKFFKKLVCELL